MPKHELHSCPNCGKEVECTGDFSCWCIQLTIPEKAQDYIAATFDGCLCRECILEIVERFCR